MSNGTVFSTRPDRSRFIPAWAHFPPRITWQMLKDSDEVAVLSAVLSCFMWRSLTRIQNSTLRWHLWEKPEASGKTYELFSPENMQTGRTDRQEIRNRQSIIFQEIGRFRFRSRIGSNYGRSFCIQCRVDSKESPPSCSFSRLKELGPIQTG